MQTVQAMTRRTQRAPTIKSRKVAPPRRRHLTPPEVDRLMRAAGKSGRYSHRDQTLVLIAYRHGLRVGELVALRWDQIDMQRGLLEVARLKNGTPSTHPLRGPEIRALRRLKREGEGSAYVFTTERGGPMTTDNARKILARLGETAGMGFRVHPHMLRHAAGYKLANDGHDTRAIQHYLGHRNIQHTVAYTELSPDRFRRFWQD